MKKIIFILTLFSIIGCTNTLDSDSCGVSPPDWLIGTWKQKNDHSRKRIVTKNDIEDRVITNTGSYGISICETVNSPATMIEFEEIESNDEFYTYIIHETSDIEEYYTYFAISETSIGFCSGKYPCSSFIEYIK